MKYLAYTNVINIDHHLTNNPTIYKDECCCDDIYFYWNDKLSAAYLTLEWFKPLIEKSEVYKISDTQIIIVACANHYK